MIAFFFSSRRRHTRWNCDWSSDVCSSDLALITRETLEDFGLVGWPKTSGSRGIRSEERRVGKECRFRWSPDHLKKNVPTDAVDCRGHGLSLARDLDWRWDCLVWGDEDGRA